MKVVTVLFFFSDSKSKKSDQKQMLQNSRSFDNFNTAVIRFLCILQMIYTCKLLNLPILFSDLSTDEIDAYADSNKVIL